MPGELHKLWQSGDVEGYHMEYGFSCMGYEIPAAIGVNLAEPDSCLLYTSDAADE